MRRTIALLLLLWLAAGCASGVARESQTGAGSGTSSISIPVPHDAARVPLEPSREGLPVIRVTVDGKPAAFVLDTGAETTILTVAAAQRLGLALVASDQKSYDAHGAVRRVMGIAALSRIQFGSISLRDQQAWCMDLPLPSGVDGLLSREAFADVVLAIDYPRRVVEVWKGELPSPDGKDILQIGVHSAGAIRIQVKIGSAEEWFVVDSGFAGKIILDRAMLARVKSKEIPLRQHSQGVNSKIQTELRQLNEPVQIGTYSFAGVIATHFPGAKNMIGSGLLKRYRVTIDQKRRRLAIAPLN